VLAESAAGGIRLRLGTSTGSYFGARDPAAAEMRFRAFNALAHGSAGLVFWCQQLVVGAGRCRIGARRAERKSGIRPERDESYASAAGAVAVWNPEQRSFENQQAVSIDQGAVHDRSGLGP